MLGGMALKWRWRDRQKAAGKPTDRPNMVMGINVQVCWEKFCRYWDVEMRLVADGGRPLPPQRRGGGQAVRREHDRRGPGARLDVRRQLRAGRRDLRRARPAPGRHRTRRPGARRRRVRRVRRAVHRPGPGVGLPPAAGAVDQRVRPQVRARVPGRGLGRLAQPGRAARRPGVQGELPRRRDADVLAELLAPGQPDRGAVLQLHPPRLRRLPAGPAGVARRRPLPGRAIAGMDRSSSSPTGASSRCSRSR